jgi:hypothetical protein
MNNTKNIETMLRQIILNENAKHMGGPPTPDCVSFLEADSITRMSSRDVELLLSDRMVDEIGRALEDYSDNNPISVCPSPRTDSPWPFIPQLSSTSSLSTMVSNSTASNPEAMTKVIVSPKKKSGVSTKKTDKLAKTKTMAPEAFAIPGFITTDVSASSLDTAFTVEMANVFQKPTKKRKAAEVDAFDEEGNPIVKVPKKNKPKPVASENTHERSRKSSSTYRGVSLCTKDSRWQARIRIRKEVVYLGRFETEEAAARRYDEAAREHHGEKALINFITDEDRALGRKCVFEQAGGKSARV